MWTERQDPDSEDHLDDSGSSAISCRPGRVNNRHIANDRRLHSHWSYITAVVLDVLLGGWSRYPW